MTRLSRKFVPASLAIAATFTVFSPVTPAGYAAAASKNGPTVYTSNKSGWVKFYADSSPNGTGDTIAIHDSLKDGSSVVADIVYGANRVRIYNTGGVGSTKYAVLNGGAGITEGAPVDYTACDINLSNDPDGWPPHHCGNSGRGIS